MGNYNLSYREDYGRFKTVRRKKRLLKKDRDKQLIQIYKRITELNNKLLALPFVPLEVPYQRGWIGTFVLRQDVAISKEAEFFQNLLEKINTEQYSHKKLFQLKRRKRGKKIYENRPQYLQMFDHSDWRRNNFRIGKKEFQLTAKERKYFSIKEIPDWRGNLVSVYYFNEQWRFVLKVKPNIITHVQMHDCELESQLEELNNYLIKNNLRNRMWRLVSGRKQHWNFGKIVEDELANKSLHKILNEYYENGN